MCNLSLKLQEQKGFRCHECRQSGRGDAAALQCFTLIFLELTS